MVVPKIAALMALLGVILLILSAMVSSAVFGVPGLDDWTMYAAEFSFLLAVSLFLGWFFAECVKEIRNTR
jgi:ABC-type transport system involved in multi-copper enzyme maturation permease subunit